MGKQVAIAAAALFASLSPCAAQPPGYVPPSPLDAPYVAARLCDPDAAENTYAPTDTHTYIGVLDSLTGHGTFYGNLVDMGVMCALDKINADPDLLNDTILEPVFVDVASTQVGAVKAGVCMERNGIYA